MSIRYGVALVPEPTFTARAYRARQLICGQYASWAAEMHPVHIPVADFFQCSDPALEALETGLGKAVGHIQRTHRGFPLVHRGVATTPSDPAHIFLDFTVPADSPQRSLRALEVLHHNVVEALRQTQGVVPDLRSVEKNYLARLPLLQYANLPPSVFADAVEFARAVVEDLQLPQTTKAWRLMLLRFESNAARDNWNEGRWAADLRWNALASYSL